MPNDRKDWWKTSVVYQIYPKSFYDSNQDGIGDIHGIIQKLDYLKNLGVDVLWLSPIYDSPQEDGGYDIRDYESIYAQYGTMADFYELLNEVHMRGMKLIMDLVVNHTSDEHHWFCESRKSKDNPYRDYYIWRDGKKGDLPPNNWGSIFSGSAWTKEEATGQYYLHLFARKQPDLNWENERLRQEVYRMMRFWLDKGVDGFRMDVINLIDKTQSLPDGWVGEGQLYGDGSPYFMNGSKVHTYLQEMYREVLSKYDIMTVGEMPGTKPEHAQNYTDPANCELDMIFTFEHMDLDCHGGDKWNIKPCNLIDLKANLAKWQTELNQIGWNSLYWNNHDQPRVVSRFGNDEAYRVQSAKMLAICLHLMKGTPYIYQGEEFGMTNVRFDNLSDYRDIETMNMVKEKRALGWSEKRIIEAIYTKGRDNARTPFQWSDEANAGFTMGEPWIRLNPRYKEINAEAALREKGSIFYTYQQLIQLRKSYNIIVDGNFTLLMKDHRQIFAYSRETETEQLIVLCNFSPNDATIDDEALLHTIQDAEVLIANDNRIEAAILSPYQAIALIKTV